MKTSIFLLFYLIIIFTDIHSGYAQPMFNKEHIVISSFGRPSSVFAIDVNNDNHVDILAAWAVDDKLSWFENDGNQNFTEHSITDTADAARYIYSLDLDDDDDTDVLLAYHDRVSWFENDGAEIFTEHIITSEAFQARKVFAIDIDMDGKNDVLSASFSDDKIAWYKNNGDKTFTEIIISDTTNGANAVHAMDMDGDHDMDVIAAGYLSGTITWYENDGSQNFTGHPITASASGSSAIIAVDMDSDQEIDILAGLGNSIVWFKNDGNENYTEKVITDTIFTVSSVYAGDLNGNGDMDVISSSLNDNKIAWYENDGSENFTKHILSDSANQGEAVFAADLDSDGDLDVFAAYLVAISWFENSGGCETSNVINRSVTICEGETFYASGKEQSESGTYYDHYGCDSTVITVLTVDACTAESTPPVSEIIKIYPIPATDELFIEYPEFSYFELYNRGGVRVMQGDTERVDMKDLVSGLYYIKVFSTKGAFTTYKIPKL
jgi:predicted lactoylglutathione lyase